MCLSSRHTRPVCFQSCVPSASSQASAAAKVVPRAREQVRAESRSHPALRKMLTDVTEGKTQTRTQRRAGLFQDDPQATPAWLCAAQHLHHSHLIRPKAALEPSAMLWAFIWFLVLNLSPVWCCICTILWHLNNRLTSSGPPVAIL